VLRRVLLLTVIGVAAGLGITFAAKRWIGSVLVLHFSHEIALLALLSVALVCAGVLAAVIPARRAASVEPMQALRME
jgi:ABC-type antimicrobial peptide transport system permease subunit